MGEACFCTDQTALELGGEFEGALRAAQRLDQRAIEHSESCRYLKGAACDGAYVSGMFLEGARRDVNGNSSEDSKPKEMFVKMPVINCKAGPSVDREEKNIYICPTYCVPTRRPYYVFPAQVRTKQPPGKWVLGGVALFLDIGHAL